MLWPTNMAYINFKRLQIIFQYIEISIEITLCELCELVYVNKTAKFFYKFSFL